MSLASGHARETTASGPRLFVRTFVHFHHLLTRTHRHTHARTRACRTLWSAGVGPRDFLNRAEFLTWKLALNPICTGRHIFGQSCATADRENEPSILYNVASLLSYLPPVNLKKKNKNSAPVEIFKLADGGGLIFCRGVLSFIFFSSPSCQMRVKQKKTVILKTIFESSLWWF